jgi:hypothetical protein
MSFSADNLKIFPEFNLLSNDEREQVFNLRDIIENRQIHHWLKELLVQTQF